jgi:hypothetical protein
MSVIPALEKLTQKDYEGNETLAQRNKTKQTKKGQGQNMLSGRIHLFCIS